MLHCSFKLNVGTLFVF